MLIGAILSPCSLVDDEKCQKKSRVGMSLLYYWNKCPPWWWCPVASREALYPLHQEMHTVTYRRFAMAIKMASKVGVFYHRHFVDCRSGSCRGNTEQVVTRWWCPGASSVALDLLHREMPRALLQCVRMATKMACNWGTFVCCRCLFCLL